MDLNFKPNWRIYELHDCKTCLCNKGEKGKTKLAATNEKKQAYYHCEAGLQTKRRYREKENLKQQILNQLSMSNMSTKASLCHETIKNYLN